MIVVFALVDTLNQPPKSNLAPLLVGSRWVSGMSVGANAGYAINPARDFGPRVFAWLAGWGDVAMPGVHGYFWVLIVGPLIGGAIGALAHDFFIRDVLVARGEQPEPDVESEGRTVEETPETGADDVESPDRMAEAARGGIVA